VREKKELITANATTNWRNAEILMCTSFQMKSFADLTERMPAGETTAEKKNMKLRTTTR